jgi:predicted oxidoreductase (fatty acid repression mutant protein)
MQHVPMEVWCLYISKRGTVAHNIEYTNPDNKRKISSLRHTQSIVLFCSDYTVHKELQSNTTNDPKTPSFYKKSFVVFDCDCPFTVKFAVFSTMQRKFLQHSYVEEISKFITQIAVRSCVVQNHFIFPSVSSQSLC